MKLYVLLDADNSVMNNELRPAEDFYDIFVSTSQLAADALAYQNGLSVFEFEVPLTVKRIVVKDSE
jgi:hypothetical protein